MQPGNTIYLTIGRQTAAGLPSSGKALGDFTIAAYVDGVAASVSPSIAEIGVNGAFQEYKAGFTVPSTAGRLKLKFQAASGYDIISPDIFEGEIESYDLDALASLFLTAQGTPGVLSAADSSLGDIVDGDSYLSGTLTMPAGKLSPFVIADISAAGITVEAAIMATPGGTSYPITVAVVSGVGLTFNIGWNTQQHPAMTTANSATWFIDVQVIKTGPPKQIITTNRYSFNQVWQRDTRTT